MQIGRDGAFFGTSPEVWRTTFEFNLNGEDWDSAGAGSRVPGGWQVSGLSRLSIPANAQLRARGFVSGGALGGSTWFVQTLGYRTTLALRVALQSGGGTVDVSWPITSNVDLFSTSSLTPPVNWQPVTSPRGRTLGTFHAYVPRTNGAAFFQLRPSP